jgi:uncharacterized protein YkwD
METLPRNALPIKGLRCLFRGLRLAPRSRVMSHPARRAIIAACLAVSACSAPAAPSALDDTGTDAFHPSAAALELVELTNAERARAGLATLRAETRLMRAAQIHADQMVRAGRLAHDLPEADFPRPQDRLTAVGYTWHAWAENVAYGQQSATTAVEAWMGSTGHRANMLGTAYTELGTGHAVDGAGRSYWVQVFARPAP